MVSQDAVPFVDGVGEVHAAFGFTVHECSVLALGNLDGMCLVSCQT